MVEQQDQVLIEHKELVQGEPLPDRLVDISLGTYRGQMFATALDIGLFDYLGREWHHIDDICKGLEIHMRIPSDFFNVLTSVGIIERKEGVYYRNAEDTNIYCVKAHPKYMGTLMHRFANIKNHAMTEWSTIIKDPNPPAPYDYNKHFANKGEAFMLWFESLMNSLSIMAAYQIPELPIWTEAKTFIDAGGGNGMITQHVCRKH